MKSTFAWLVAAGLALPNVVSAQAPVPGHYSTPQFEVRASRGHRVKMRDGVRLSVDVYRPDARGPHPGLLAITPYNNNAAGWMQRAQWFARRGYAVAIADSRGRFD